MREAVCEREAARCSWALVGVGRVAGSNGAGCEDPADLRGHQPDPAQRDRPGAQQGVRAPEVETGLVRWWPAQTRVREAAWRSEEVQCSRDAG